MFTFLQPGPRLAACALEIVVRLPQAGKGLSGSSKHLGPVVLRRVQRVSTGVLGNELAELAGELAEDIATTPLAPGVLDLFLLAVVLVAVTVWWRYADASTVYRWRSIRRVEA